MAHAPTLLITTAEAARRLGVSRERVRQLLETGMLAGVAVEFRHDSWFTAETRALLEQRGAALVSRRQGLEACDAAVAHGPLGYVRWHHGRAVPEPCYGGTALRSWARRVAELWSRDEDVFCFFNNDPLGCALRDARSFAGQVRRAGREPSRVPKDTVAVH